MCLADREIRHELVSFLWIFAFSYSMPLVQALLEALVEGQTDGRLQGLMLIFIMLWPGPMLNSDIIKSCSFKSVLILAGLFRSFHVFSSCFAVSIWILRTLQDP